MRLRTPALTILAAGWMACSPAWARTDWPAWRGPNGDGLSEESKWNPAALKDGAKVKWTAELGDGYSGVTISGAHLFSMGNVSNQDVVYCLDVDSGKEVWRYAYPCKSGDYPGPRATPVEDGDRVYTLSREGDLLCLNAKSSTLVWRVDILKVTKAENIGWGFSASPLVVGDRVLVNAGRTGLAANKRNGDVIWSSAGKGGYAAPVLYKSGTQSRVALFSQKDVCSVDVANGKEVWSYPWPTGCDVNAADPIVTADQVFISSGYDHGCALLRVKGDKVGPVWENKSLRNHFSSSVLIQGFVYGIDGNAGNGTLRCLNLATGEEQWSQNVGFGGLMAADGNLIILNEQGTLIIAAAKPAAYTEISRADGAVRVPEGAKCWTAPVLCRGLIYGRNSKGTLVCVDVSR